MSFCHLHRHSEFSLLDGLGTANQYVEQAVLHGQESLGLTDHGNMGGALQHHEVCTQAGIKPIIGMEAYFKPDRGVKDKENRKAYHLVLHAKNEKGFRNLISMSSEAYVSGFYFKPCVDYDLLKRYSDGIICTTACMSSYVNSFVIKGDSTSAQRELQKLKEIFGDDLFMEIMPHAMEEQRIVNNAVIGLAEENSLPVIATVDAHYPYEDWCGTQDIVLMLSTKQSFEKRAKKIEKGEDIYKFDCDTLWLMPEEEVERLFSLNHPNIPAHIVKESINNTKLLSDKVSDFTISKKNKMPKIKEDSYKTIIQICSDRLDNLFGDAIPPEYAQRLNTEMQTMKEMNVLDYIYIVWDMVRWAKENKIRVGPGRGSSAGSIVCYLLDITEVDPMVYGLMFERFLNPDRVQMPDIDVDFQSDRREEVKKYLADKWGADKVVELSTFQTFKPKSSIKRISTVYDVPFDEINKITRTIDDKEYPTLESIYDNYDEIRNFSEKYPEVWEHAKRIEGQVSGLSQHASAVAITDEPINYYMPTIRSKGGGIVTGWSDKSDFPVISTYGILKIDCLGTKGLETQGLACDLIKENTGEEVNLSSLPVMKDPWNVQKEVMDAFSKGLTCGVWQFSGSQGFSSLIKNIKPDWIGDLAAANAIYRPGPLSGGVQISYFRRKHGLEKVEYFHPDAEEILGKNYGLVIYQEDVMKLAQKFANFTGAEADDLRKVMGKEYRRGFKHVIKYLNDHGYEEKWITGCAEYGLDKKLSKKIWEIIVAFGGYGFNFSHAVAYAIQSYQDMWLKINYPREFYTALLTSDPSLINEVSRESDIFGISIKPPDINKSGAGFTMVDNDIYFGLSAVKGLGPKGVDAILELRPFSSMDEFKEAIPGRACNSAVRTALEASGAFDSIGGRESWHKLDIISAEKEVLGISLTEENPIKNNLELLKSYLYTEEELSDKPEGFPATIGGEVERVKVIKTKGGKEMAFADISFLHERLSVTLFPEEWDCYKNFIRQGEFILARTKKNTYNNKTSYICDYACLLNEFVESKTR